MAIRAVIVLALGWSVCVAQAQTAFPWQQSHARVLPNGGLEWTPRPFTFTAGPVVRFIDFENGNDANPGTRERPWKRHPWDPEATGQAAEFQGPATYVFRRGVTYRGRFVVGEDAGQPGNPIRLTSDPSWGEGEARIYASERVTRWTRGAAPGMPNPERVWTTEVDWLPRNLWQLEPDGDIVRLKLARDPNWQESDRNDVVREWLAWENPLWWQEGSRYHRMHVDGRDLHLGIHTQYFTRPAADYVGATVWTEWGIVMGSPYPARIEAFDERQRGVAFRGPWTFDMLEVIARGNRFHLEDKAWMLDEPGEFWVERLGDSRARIYLRLPGDTDPNQAVIEAGRHIHVIDATQLRHVEVSGLTFRFTNVHWHYYIPFWAHPDHMTAVVRLNGPGEDIVVRNNVFDHVHMPVRLRQTSVESRIGRVSITDNVMTNTDHGGVEVMAHFGDGIDPQFAPVDHVDFLRNRMYRIGWRILSGEHGHAVNLNFPTSSHVAGNFLYRIAGWGLCIFGGKPHGRAGAEVPFNRHLMHHNRVEDALVKSNDWGAVETWQGGPQYVFNNLVLNPLGFKHWTWREGDPNNIGSFGHAYYLDAGFKHYYFNNIAWGRNNTPGTRSVNTTALQNILSFENTFWHNSFFRFAEATRQQEPSAGRFRYFSNVIDDVSVLAMRHADPTDLPPDPNAPHFTQVGQFAYETLAYRHNVFHNLRGRFGVFEETGVVYNTMEQFRDALRQVRPQAAEVGVVAQAPPMRNPAGFDFRPSPNSAALGLATKVFVPWSLYGVAGEWHFTRNNRDPSVVIDEHWFMTGNYGLREHYRYTPRYPLVGRGISSANFVMGTLEDWAPGAVQLNGRDQFFAVTHASLYRQPRVPASRVVETSFGRVIVPEWAAPGRPFEVIVELNPAHAEARPRADLHWLRREGYGGFMSWGGLGEPVGERRLRFRVEPTRVGGLHQYNLHVSHDPEQPAPEGFTSVDIPVEVARGLDLMDPAAERTVNLGDHSFLVEVVLQTRDQEGLIAGKHDGTTGYELDLYQGRPRLRISVGGQHHVVTARTAVNNGAWRHLVAEFVRGEGVRLYVDGRRVEAEATGPVPTGPLANGADFLVGGGPGKPHLAGLLDFLRVSRGSLADARTTIEELHTWQFNGPQFRDFAGHDRRRHNAAGALTR